MIVSGKQESYDGQFRLVQYETTADGQCVPQLRHSDFESYFDSYFAQQAEKFVRRHRQWLAGEISPIGFFMDYLNMTVPDAAARLKLSAGKVKKHLTPEGFARVDVETLGKYARLFDITVSDFFQFLFVPETVQCRVEHFHDRRLAHVTIQPPADGAA
jgi:hypothetical protein